VPRPLSACVAAVDVAVSHCTAVRENFQVIWRAASALATARLLVIIPTVLSSFINTPVKNVMDLIDSVCVLFSKY